MIPRIFSAEALTSGAHIVLDPVAARHLRESLRLGPGDSVVLFDGRGGEYAAELVALNRVEASARIGAKIDIERESPLAITLAQGISRGERMDFTLQKAVELGVARIVPLATERSTVRLDEDRARKRLDHWQGIIRHAGEQCGRTRLPVLDDLVRVSDFATKAAEVLRVTLDPAADVPLAALSRAPSVCLAIGPEGGFSAGEREVLSAAGFVAARLGPRVLRTETAALVALSVLQSRFGDLASPD